MSKLRRLISFHLLLLGVIYIVDGAVLQNPAYIRQFAIMPGWGYGITMLTLALLIATSRSAVVYAAVAAGYVLLALSFWNSWTAVITYFWMAGLVTVIGRLDDGYG